ncbi:uracil-DNA glycosylase [Patescibacteria group bacterium]
MSDPALLKHIEKNVKACSKCRLCETAKNSVPGEGSSTPKIAFVGEAPGRYEDESGRPFVGRAGKLLEKALEQIGYTREDVWIGNIIKHRPPSNRDPLPDEIAACSPYLTMQLKALDPPLIVTLGRFALNYFYPEGKISRDRGHMFKIGDYNVFPVYHPAAALRRRSVLADFLRDFKKIPQVLEKIESGKTGDVSEEADGQLGLF